MKPGGHALAIVDTRSKLNRQRHANAPVMKQVIAVVLAAATIFRGTAQAADAERGEQIHHSCQDCHSLGVNEVGPSHLAACLAARRPWPAIPIRRP